MIYVTADLHLGHENICKGLSSWDDKSTCRPFDTVEQMNKTLLDGVNTLTPDDVLIHLGDFAFGNPQRFLPYLKPHVIFVKGNHDRRLSTVDFDDMFTYPNDIYKFEYGGKYFSCCHYPMLSWIGDIMLHGHCHLECRCEEFYKTHNILDVCTCEEKNWIPWNIDDIIHKFYGDEDKVLI